MSSRTPTLQKIDVASLQQKNEEDMPRPPIAGRDTRPATLLIREETLASPAMRQTGFFASQFLHHNPLRIASSTRTITNVAKRSISQEAKRRLS
jgi:hypothetical protein